MHATMHSLEASLIVEATSLLVKCKTLSMKRISIGLQQHTAMTIMTIRTFQYSTSYYDELDERKWSAFQHAATSTKMFIDAMDYIIVKHVELKGK